jgi:uncharacterized protein YjiK
MKRIVFAIAIVAMFAVQTFADSAALFPRKWHGNIDKTGFAEPSGIVYHPGRGTLFVVSDEGLICEMSTDGKRLNTHKFRDKVVGARPDFEGITVNPATGLLYVAVEGAESILEIDPVSLVIHHTLMLERTFRGKTVLVKGGQGIEGITFVPDAKGGLFYISNQAFPQAKNGELSVIITVRLPEKRENAVLPIASVISMKAYDISGLCYDKSTDRLMVLSDMNNALMQMTRAGVIEHTWAFPGQAQEGIALGPGGDVYIAQDSGGVIKMRWLK